MSRVCGVRTCAADLCLYTFRGTQGLVRVRLARAQTPHLLSGLRSTASGYAKCLACFCSKHSRHWNHHTPSNQRMNGDRLVVRQKIRSSTKTPQYHPAIQRQTAVTVYLKSNELLYFAFTLPYMTHGTIFIDILTCR